MVDAVGQRDHRRARARRVLVIGGVQGWRWWSGKQRRGGVGALLRRSAMPRARTTPPRRRTRWRSSPTSYARHRLRAARGAAVREDALRQRRSRRREGAAARGWSSTRSEDELKAIARFRLAEVQLDEKQYDDALRTLDAKHRDAFAGVYADLRGDALAAAGRVAEARTAYQTALAKLDPKSPYRNYVQVKHDALGGAAPAAAAAPTVLRRAGTPAAAGKAPAPAAVQPHAEGARAGRGEMTSVAARARAGLRGSLRRAGGRLRELSDRR